MSDKSHVFAFILEEYHAEVVAANLRRLSNGHDGGRE